MNYDATDMRDTITMVSRLNTLTPRAKERLEELIYDNLRETWDNDELDVDEVLEAVQTISSHAFNLSMHMFAALTGEDLPSVLHRLLSEEDWEIRKPDMGRYPWYFDVPKGRKFWALAFDEDCPSGSQFVKQEIPYTLIVEAFQAKDFFEYLDLHAKTEYVEIGTDTYTSMMNYYTNCKRKPVCIMPAEGDTEGRLKAMHTLAGCVAKFLTGEGGAEE